jgi:hypothetical protein
MDELLQLLISFMEQIEGNFDQMDDAEANEISEFLIESMTQIMDLQRESESKTALQPQIPQGADLLWILSNGDVNAFVNYLRTYPGEGLQELAQNPTQLSSVIAKLQQQNPGQEPGIGPDGIPNTMYQSSNVLGMKYDPSNGSLLVKFFGNGKKDPVYQYSNVSPQIFKILEHGNAFAKTTGSNSRGRWWKFKSPSIGAAVNQYLKAGGYPYQRLN